jgi:phenylalanyl-tRNA synthetase alpha chain
MIEYKQITTTSFVLTEEGLDIAANGSHEYRVWEALPPKGGAGLGMPELMVCPTFGSGLVL